MTQAFNLAQLANNLNTSGQLDATDGLNGLVANANLASSGTASSSTFLRGDRTWATVTQKILQVVSTSSTGNFTSTSSSFADFLSLSITPSSTSSKILCFATYGEPDVLTGYVRVNLQRGAGNTIFTLTTEFGRGIPNTSESHYSGASTIFLDSPASTSTLTYSLALAVAISGTARIGNGGNHSLVLMEIGA